MKNILTFASLISDNKEWTQFSNYYSDKGFIELLGLFRYEDVHNNYLKNILDKNNVYNYKLKPMKYFLKLVNKKNKNWFGDLSDENEIKHLKVNTRKKLFNSGIPDIFITFNFKNKNYFILLESKLGSDEHKDQCSNYHKEAEKLKGYDEKIYLYLTLDGSKPDSCKHNDWYNLITYQDLINDLYEPLMKESNNISLTIEEYLKGFNSLYTNGLIKDDKNIPITNEGKKLTENLFKIFKSSKICEKDYDNMEDFYNKYKNIVRIFLKNIKIIVESKHLKSQWLNQEEVDNVLSSLYELDSNKAKYCIDKKEFQASKYVYNVFKRLIDDDINNKISLNNTFNLINLAPDGYKYLYTKAEYNKLQSYRNCYSNHDYGELLYKGKKYYYAVYSIKEDEVEELINNIIDKFPTYSDSDVFKIKYSR